MINPEWHIYIGKIPYNEKGNFWVSFESDSGMKKTNANIYGRCLPCIRNLYQQLKDGCTEIALGTAFECWKVAVVLDGIEACLSLLKEFEEKFPAGHVYGKFGSGRKASKTMVVVFHAENVVERDRIRDLLERCSTAGIGKNQKIQVSRACAVLYNDILGDWRHWEQTTLIKYPENREEVLERVKQVLYRAAI